MELYTVIEKNKIMKLAGRQMDLEITSVSELTQTQKHRYISCVSPIRTMALTWHLGVAIDHKIERVLETGKVGFKERGGRRQ